VLKIESLPESTRKVFLHLAASRLAQGLTLIGGSAMALQVGHRNSEDLDFWLPAEKLDKGRIASLIDEVRLAGFDAQLITPHHKIVAAKINGHDLLAHVQDYTIDGAKVTFFARADVPYRHFDTFDRLSDAQAEGAHAEGTQIQFAIMGLEGIFAMKSYVIHQRVRSRDLLDLKTFVLAGKTLDDILKAGTAADPTCSPEVAKAILCGEIPLDQDDEGFESIGLETSFEDVLSFFRQAIDDHEQAIAEAIAQEHARLRTHDIEAPRSRPKPG